MRTRTLLGAAAAGLLLLGACGGDDAIEVPAGADDASSQSSGDDASDDTADDGNGGALPGAIMGEDCAEVFGAFMQALGGAINGTSFDGLDDAIDSVESQVPDDVADDVRTLAEVYRVWGEVMSDHDNDIAKVMSDPDAVKAMENLSNPEVQAASDNITAYFDEACPGLSGS